MRIILFLLYHRTKREAECSINYHTEKELDSLNTSEHVNYSTDFHEIQNSSKSKMKATCDDSFLINNIIYVYAGIVCTCVVLLLFRAVYYYTLAMNASKNLHNKMFSNLTHASMRFFDINPSGRILNRFSRDIGIIDEQLPHLILEALQVSFSFCNARFIIIIINIILMSFFNILGNWCHGWYFDNSLYVEHLYDSYSGSFSYSVLQTVEMVCYYN